MRIKGGHTCHVCGCRLCVGIWRDKDGNHLQACGEPACVKDYAYQGKLRRQYEEKQH